MAGLLAAGAAAFDSRIAAVFSIDGLYDFKETTVLDKNKGLAQFSHIKDFSAAQAIFNDPKVPTTLRWALSHALWAFNCPLFIGDADDDHFFKGQPERMEYAISDNATRVVFTKDDAAGEHCQEGASRFCHQVVFDMFEEKVVETENGDVL
ncbi:putative AB hydrolase-1 domain-containing protein [Seiridium cardinale]